MSKYFIKSITLKEYLFFFLLIMITPVFITNHVNTLDTFLHSHFITLVWNNLYLIFWYHSICKLNEMTYMLIPRITLEKFYTNLFKLSTTVSLLYSLFITFYTIILTAPVPQSYNHFLLLYLLLMILSNFIESSLILLHIGSNKHLIFIAISILLNISLHYAIMPSIFSFIK